MMVFLSMLNVTIEKAASTFFQVFVWIFWKKHSNLIFRCETFSFFSWTCQADIVSRNKKQN